MDTLKQLALIDILENIDTLPNNFFEKFPLIAINPLDNRPYIDQTLMNDIVESILKGDYFGDLSLKGMVKKTFDIVSISKAEDLNKFDEEYLNSLNKLQISYLYRKFMSLIFDMDQNVKLFVTNQEDGDFIINYFYKSFITVFDFLKKKSFFEENADSNGLSVMLTIGRIKRRIMIDDFFEEDIEEVLNDNIFGRDFGNGSKLGSILYILYKKIPSALQLLTQFGFDLNTGTDTKSLLVKALEDFKIGHASTILNYGGNVNYKFGYKKETALHYFTFTRPRFNKIDERLHKIVHFLIKNGADPNVQDNDGNTPLHNIARNGLHWLFLLESYLEYHNIIVNTSIQNENGNTPLHLLALKSENIHAMIMMINKTNIHIQNENGLTPLHCSAKTLKVNYVKKLLERESDPNKKDNDGNTPLHLVVLRMRANGKDDLYKIKQIIDLLISNGGSKKLINKDGKTPIKILKSK